MNGPARERRDLTRWNRAGLSRFQFVDGNAATWLEELRLKFLTLYLRGVPEERRQADYWRDLFRRDKSEWPNPETQLALLSRLDWETLWRQFPPEPEDTRRLNARLVDSYQVQSQDYAHEIARAFARAAHILLGHADAYANEGYIRTASQWDNVRRLAAMVGYQPTPPASASTTVALIAAEDAAGVLVDRGLAMKYAPPDGGKPVVFETIDKLTVHPDLNAARERRYLKNRSLIDFSRPSRWVTEAKDLTIGTGALAVVAPAKGDAPSAKALRIKHAQAEEEGGPFELTFERIQRLTGKWRKGYTKLLVEPDQVLVGLPKPEREDQIVFELANTAQFRVGDVVEIKPATGSLFQAVVQDLAAGAVTVGSGRSLAGGAELSVLAQYPVKSSRIVETGPEVGEVFFNVDGTSFRKLLSSAVVDPLDTHLEGTVRDGEKDIAHRFLAPEGHGATGFARAASGTVTLAATVAAEPAPISADFTDRGKTVEFTGKPPKSLVTGDYFVARHGGRYDVLRVLGLRTESDRFAVTFNKVPPGPPHRSEFHGPMKVELRPEGHDRGVHPAVDADGTVVLAWLSEDAKGLIKPGREVIVEDEREDGRAPVLATISSVDRLAAESGGTGGERDQARVSFAAAQDAFSGFEAGWTLFRFNTAKATHGESRGSKVLGSGNGELPRQSFNLAVPEISFVPDSSTESGVVPDIDVQVAGVGWDYRDLLDPEAEGAKAYSTVVKEDGSLDIVFRRRLQTGRNNVVVTRHRVGIGAAGNAIPPYGFTKPMKKHKAVTAISQPFETAGGAEREPAAAVRGNAPSQLKANARAVSLSDFEKLTERHTSIWQARAEQVLEPGRELVVRLTVVPAFGAALTATLEADLRSFILAKALPNVSVRIHRFKPVRLKIEATIRVNPARYGVDQVRQAAEDALVSAFALQWRGLGQPVFIAEVLAALEGVEGLETARAKLARHPSTPQPVLRTVTGTASGLRALFPTAEQVAYLASAVDVDLTVEEVQ